MKVTINWAKTKDDFIVTGLAGEWIITTKNELIKKDICFVLPKGATIKKEIMVVVRAVYHTTDFLRLFCNEHHPEIDFDTEFETDKPGVFARYEDKYGHDYEDGVMELEYEALKEELAKIGYELPWE
jgi:hypothetical protein